jgi:hypothetical protein
MVPQPYERRGFLIKSGINLITAVTSAVFNVSVILGALRIRRERFESVTKAEARTDIM